MSDRVDAEERLEALRERRSELVHGPLLSQAEADALDGGTLVIVTWSGGNGPHPYIVEIGPYDRRYAGDVRNNNPLTFVGSERYHTHVSRVAQPLTAPQRGATTTVKSNND